MPDTANAPWVIELTTPGMTKPLQVRLENRLIVGRSVAGESRQPDIDLGAYSAEEAGVSRLHLSVFSEDDQLRVMDMESGNGTFIGSKRLKPLESYPIANSEEITLGRLPLKIQVIVSPSYGGDIHKQPSLQLQDQAHPGSGQPILIIEDDPEVAKILAFIMERAGYTTKISYEVVGAIRLFNQKPPSAIILDVMLPGMNGLEFCRYVRRDTRHNTTPIIIVSAAKSSDRVTEAMQAGADIFLEKPVSAKELRHVVTSLITQHESGYTSLHTKHLVGTAPLKAITPESRRDSAVLFVAGYSDAPIVVNVHQPISFGRTTTTTESTSKTHIDLSRYEAVNYGVSRMHMRLHNKDGQFFVEDTASVNGTYLNGDPIKPHVLMPINNADEIRLGRLRMYIYFLTDMNGAMDDEEDEGETT